MFNCPESGGGGGGGSGVFADGGSVAVCKISPEDNDPRKSDLRGGACFIIYKALQASV